MPVPVCSPSGAVSRRAGGRACGELERLGACLGAGELELQLAGRELKHGLIARDCKNIIKLNKEFMPYPV